MNIVVCVKQVVDTEAVIALDGAGEVELTGQTMVIDPYSEFAVERAVQLKEELGGTVTLLTLGSQDCLAAVRHGLAMGADAAVLIEDDQWTARDAAQGRGPARRGGLHDGRRPHHGRLEVPATRRRPRSWGAWRPSWGSLWRTWPRVFPWKATPSSRNARWMTAWRPRAFLLPAVVAAQQGLAEPRYPSVRDVMQARRRGAEVRPVADLAAAAEPTTVTVVSRELKPGRSGGRIVAGEAPEAVAETVRLLAEEAKVL